MALDVEKEAPSIESLDYILGYFEAGEKSKDNLKIGLEHEKIPFHADTLAPVTYDSGIQALLLGLEKNDWNPILENNQIVALKKGMASVTIEPGGQFEFSGSPLASIHEVADEYYAHMDELVELCAQHGIAMSSFGSNPLIKSDDMPWMPRERYRVMRRYLPTRGRSSVDMMVLSATAQSNFDYTSEDDMIAKMRCGMSATAIVAGIFANSPYFEGTWQGYRSTRYAWWRNVDPQRCGLLEFVFADDFGYKKYLDYILDMPIMFLRRRGEYLDAHHKTFRQFCDEGFEGEWPNEADFENHVATAFPEVRLKQFIETRCADSCPPELNVAMAALWKGLLYDDEAMQETISLLADLSFEERLAMQLSAAQSGLEGYGANWHMGELAKTLLKIADAGLERQNLVNEKGQNECLFLDPIRALVEKGECLAEHLLKTYGSGPLNEDAQRALLLGASYDGK
ncbi:MAG: glutamate-cysteine ligase family protein [Myxococcota bacterium]|jgi:glutamate--cysteine ligase|nr:glutamate-cysteine ligase family protein [Myxococcota bacterium]